MNPRVLLQSSRIELDSRLLDQLEVHDAFITLLERLGRLINGTSYHTMYTILHLRNGQTVYTCQGYPRLSYNPSAGIITFAGEWDIDPQIEDDVIWATVDAGDIKALEVDYL